MKTSVSRLLCMLLSLCMAFYTSGFSVQVTPVKIEKSLNAVNGNERVGFRKRVVGFFRRKSKVNNTPVDDAKVTKVPQPLKSKKEDDKLKAKYESIECIEERAYTILVDLGMVTENKLEADEL